MTQLLYRGVNHKMYEELSGELRPKKFTPFTLAPKWNESSWDDTTWKESENNAVIAHQRNQAGYPTSGVSFTPHLNVAINYATNSGHYSSGYIYVVNFLALSKFGIKFYDVNKIVSKPSVPEDEEIILVSKDFGILPKEIIIEVRKIVT